MQCFENKVLKMERDDLEIAARKIMSTHDNTKQKWKEELLYVREG
jgi:hypothetical protein